MANASGLITTQPFRGVIVGYPGSGKTGALASLANAGLKIRVLAFDKLGNIRTLFAYTKPEFLPNIDVTVLEDKMRVGLRMIETAGIPEAFARGLRQMDDWKVYDAQGAPELGPDGKQISLGHSKDWGPDTLVALDSVTSMGDAAIRRQRALQNKTTESQTDRVYNLSMGEQEAFIEMLMNSSNRFHVLLLSHLRLIQPKDKRKGDSPIAEQIKEEAADIMPSKLWPSVLGYQLPQQVGRHFPTILEARQKVVQGKIKRVLKTVTDLPLDLRVAAFNGEPLPAELPIETGMLTIFDAVSPGWRDALGSPAPAGSVVPQEKAGE